MFYFVVFISIVFGCLGGMKVGGDKRDDMRASSLETKDKAMEFT